jgi:hypothetical protein
MRRRTGSVRAIVAIDKNRHHERTNMAHVLTRLRGIKAEEIGKILKADAPKRAKRGLHLAFVYRSSFIGQFLPCDADLQALMWLRSFLTPVSCISWHDSLD